jgi:hypothetical protein
MREQCCPAEPTLALDVLLNAPWDNAAAGRHVTPGIELEDAEVADYELW